MARKMWARPIPGLTAASTDETKSNEIPLASLSQVGGTLKWSAGVSAGKVVFEIAPTAGYTGTWEVIASWDFVADSQAADSVVSFSYPGPFSGFGRWRIDTAITGGTVTTDTQGLID